MHRDRGHPAGIEPHGVISGIGMSFYSKPDTRCANGACAAAPLRPRQDRAMRAGRHRAVLPTLWLGAIAAAGCASAPVSVERVDPHEVHRELTANVLSTGRPSPRSLQLLERFSLRERFEEDPVATLASLHQGLKTSGDHRRLSALGELCFDHAKRSGDRRYYAMAAVYSWALLFPGAVGETLDASDPRVRLAYDLYNRGLTEALALDADGEVSARPGIREFPLPIGRLVVELSEDEMVWAGHRLISLVPAADLAVEGFRNRYRRPGIGAPLSAALGERLSDDAMPRERFMPGLRVPATMVARIDDPRAALASGDVRVRIEIYTPDEAGTVSIDGHDVPIEFETTSSLAAGLADSPFWDFELRGFFSGSFRPIRQAVMGTDILSRESSGEGLLFLSPYRRGRIPLVLVHGTASSPGRWADLVNELENDRVIYERYQIWLFLYNTGNPIGYSGSLLRQQLERALAELDPKGRDPALRKMVIAGHSQGGLLTKLTAIDSGDRLWSIVSTVPPEELDVAPEVRVLVRQSAFFAPLPFVKRVIFICTPHRGSYLAGLQLMSLNPAKWISDLVALPSNLMQVSTELVTRNRDKLVLRGMNRMPTSIDNMTPGNPFIKTLADIPVAPGIRAHSIIAVKGDGAVERGSDGVVAYASAHLDGVESELVVRSGHSAQGRAETIEEMRRILLVHAPVE
jgi:pimeloyl-ACP methyl ester carboxylesterase